MTAVAPENLLIAWAQLLFDSLAAAGVERVIVSPGSRSTPFVLAAARNPRLKLQSAIDERAAAYFALGQARATGQPSLLLCTSGTAGAHYLPAVIEADAAGVPLLVMTADRPTELLHVGANQTIDQRLLFEGYARRVVDLGAPDAALPALRGLRRLAAQAVALTRAPIPGAVHLNVRARKPLEPIAPESPAAQALDATIRELIDVPVPHVAEGRLTAASDAIDALAQQCVRAKRGVIVAGPAAVEQTRARQQVAELTAATGFPLLAEAASQLRFIGCTAVEYRGRAVVDAFDWLYQLPAGNAAWRPDLIIQLGAPPTSGSWERLLDKHPGIARVVISPWGWLDPHSTACNVIHADVGSTCAELARTIVRLRAAPATAVKAFADTLADANTQVMRIVDADVTASGDNLTEGAVAQLAAASLPSGAWLVLGNSLPIRAVDAYCPGPLNDVRVVSQRGVSGIDGLVAGAAGVASVADGPVVLLTGDVSFLHDIGALMLGSAARVPLIIVVVDNSGGRIFEQLPVARSSPEAVMRYFTTPHECDFAHAAQLFGHAFERVQTRAALSAALSAAYQRTGCTVIDAVVPPHGAAADSARIVAALRQNFGNG